VGEAEVADDGLDEDCGDEAGEADEEEDLPEAAGGAAAEDA
jgi:hypothetical protein